MKSTRLKIWISLVLFLCGIALITVLYVPMWRIDLVAPQYPEGLRLLIFPDTLGGNVDIINGLNHYIGMKTLHTEDFIEFTLLPYIIGSFAALFFIVSLLRKKKWLYLLFILFVSFGIIAMADFWRWEYNYGHNLDPTAAIIVPGMAYQPPLIGFKQLLNFGAYSIPDIGGWIFLSVGVLLLFCVIIEVRASRKELKVNPRLTGTAIFLLAILFIGCNRTHEPIKYGVDQCGYCKMTIMNPRFGAELITKKGKIFKFDEIGCLLSYNSRENMNEKEIAEIYMTDFSGNNLLLKKESSLFMKSAKLKSPMGGNVAAFSSPDSLQIYTQKFDGVEVTWDQLLSQ